VLWGSFPFTLALEVDRSPLYASRLERRDGGMKGGQEGERALNTQLGNTVCVCVLFLQRCRLLPRVPP